MHRLTLPRLVAAAAVAAAAISTTATGPVPPAGAVTLGWVVDLTDALGWWAGEDDLLAEIGPDLTGSVGFADAQVGRGMAFDHADDVSVASLPTISEGLTLEAWIRPEPTGFAQTLFSRWTFIGGETDDSYALLVTESDIIFYTDEASLLWPETLSAPAPELFDGELHHVAATWGEGEIVLYVDGTALASAPAQPGPLNAAASTPFRLGSSSGVGRLPYQGVLDEPTVFGRALSANEVAAIHEAGPAGKCGPGWQQQAELTAADAAANDHLGISVDVDGDTAVVGAYRTDGAGSSSGSAYVYTRSAGTWTQQAELTASDAAANDLFGTSVAVAGDTVVVGSYLDDHASGTDAGSAYVFTRSGATWTEQAKLTASDAAAGDNFGISVALDGDTALVGSWFNGDGAAYAFTRSAGTWSEQAKLDPSDPSGGDRFGGSVALAAETAVIGAYRDDLAGSDRGSAHVFTRSGTAWSQEATLTAPDGADADWFGYSVAVDGDRAVVGAYQDDDAGSASGSAYVFTRSGSAWAQETKLAASDAAAGDAFGSTVAVAGDWVIVGSSQDDDGGASSGAAYAFLRDAGGAWAQDAKLTPTDATGFQLFGNAVALDGLTALIGAWTDSTVSNAAGAAYVFEFFP